MAKPLLSLKGLKKYFPISDGNLLARTTGYIKAVDDVSFDINYGQTLGLVGESGCGKTTTSFLLLQLYQPTAGSIELEGQEIGRLRGREKATYRKTVQAVFQDPYASLSPRQRVRDIIAEPLVVNTRMTKAEIDARVKEVLLQVGLPPESSKFYPHEFSGGQRQRIAIARALALKPKLIVLDEPVSGLDISIRAQVTNLMKDLQEKLGVAYLLISHDLANVRYMSHWVVVMYLGRIVESAAAEELFTHPMHPYTKALLAASLPSHPDVRREGTALPGEVPSPIKIPSGCRFHPRCPSAMKLCSEIEPAQKAENEQHSVACHLY